MRVVGAALSRRKSARARMRALAVCTLLVAAVSGATAAGGGPVDPEARRALGASLAELLPELRIEEAQLSRALDAPRRQACRNLSLLWRAAARAATPAETLTDGSITILHQAACRDEVDPRPPARLRARGILIVALDRDGALIWWSELADPRFVRPMLGPSTGSVAADRESKVLHAQRIRAGAATFEVAMPADRRIALVQFHEGSRREGKSQLVSLGSVTVTGVGGGAESESRAPARESAARAEAAKPAARAAPGQALQMEVEAESLAKTGAIEVTGGQARTQSMDAFGPGWSGGEQLFWSGGKVGAVLDLAIDVPVAANYALEIYMTRAPDYGQLRFEIDGKASATTFDGMAPKVMASGPTQLGTFPLQAGARRVSLMITGKHAQSTGHFAGIDKLRLYPAGPIN